MKIKPPPDQRDWAPETSPTFWVNHASRLVMRAFEQELRPLGLGMAYLPVVIALHESGPLTQKALAGIARVEQPTMAALLVRMERDGIIARRQSETDRRSADIALTEAGRTALGEARDRMERIVDRALAGFDGADNARLMALLQRMVANLGGGSLDG
jgi:MarR family transcriptional regulator, transcriptional regulator for hemolysin